jgi:predicted small secreted protein
MKRTGGRRRIGVVLCCLVAICLAGCATARGLGQDTQSLGRSIEADRRALRASSGPLYHVA